MANNIARYGAPIGGSEKEQIGGFLDHYRRLMVSLCDGLRRSELTRSTVDSGTTILGLVKHLTLVEDSWFRERFRGGEAVDWEFDPADPDRDLRVDEDEDTESILRLYEEACERSRDAFRSASLDDHAVHPDYRDYNLRWIALHMLEEIARHAGHADIIREQIDGRIGAGYDYGGAEEITSID